LFGYVCITTYAAGTKPYAKGAKIVIALCFYNY